MENTDLCKIEQDRKASLGSKYDKLEELRDEWRLNNYNDLLEIETITFGKYKGRSWNIVSTEYIRWLQQNNLIKNVNIKKALLLQHKIISLKNSISHCLRDNYD